jgi:hypothetical protein
MSYTVTCPCYQSTFHPLSAAAARRLCRSHSPVVLWWCYSGCSGVQRGSREKDKKQGTKRKGVQEGYHALALEVISDGTHHTLLVSV